MYMQYSTPKVGGCLRIHVTLYRNSFSDDCVSSVRMSKPTCSIAKWLGFSLSTWKKCMLGIKIFTILHVVLITAVTNTWLAPINKDESR